MAYTVANASYADKLLDLFMLLILLGNISLGLKDALRRTCEECATSVDVPQRWNLISLSEAKSSLWQHISQCDQPEGRRSAQEGWRGGANEG